MIMIEFYDVQKIVGILLPPFNDFFQEIHFQNCLLAEHV